MDIDNILDAIEHQYIKDIQTYSLVRENTIDNMIYHIRMNFFLILFTMSCITSLLCCTRKTIANHKYTIIPNTEVEPVPVKTSVVYNV